MPEIHKKLSLEGWHSQLLKILAQGVLRRPQVMLPCKYVASLKIRVIKIKFGLNYDHTPRKVE